MAGAFEYLLPRIQYFKDGIEQQIPATWFQPKEVQREEKPMLPVWQASEAQGAD